MVSSEECGGRKRVQKKKAKEKRKRREKDKDKHKHTKTKTKRREREEEKDKEKDLHLSLVLLELIDHDLGPIVHRENNVSDASLGQGADLMLDHGAIAEGNQRLRQGQCEGAKARPKA